MIKDQIEGNWKEIKGKITKQWGNITDNDLTKLKGTRQELEGLLQKKYGYQKEKIEKEIDDFISKHGYS